MMDSQVRKTVEKALAFAHAAIDDPTPSHVAEAKRYAARVLPSIARATSKGLSLGDARDLVDLVGQLRAVLQVAEQKAEIAEKTGTN